MGGGVTPSSPKWGEGNPSSPGWEDTPSSPGQSWYPVLAGGGGTPFSPGRGSGHSWGLYHLDLGWGPPVQTCAHSDLGWGTPHPDLEWGNPFPPVEVWTDTQSENLTFPHSSGAGAKNLILCTYCPSSPFNSHSQPPPPTPAHS